MRRIQRLLSGILALVMILSLGASALAAETEDGKIVILHTNDVHCAIDHVEKDGVVTGAGYSGLAALRAETEAAYGRENVFLVDCGDSIQGQAMGTLTHGEAIVDLMNRVGYDIAIPGNHEFDWGVDNFSQRVEQAEYTYLCCNFTDMAGKALYAPYEVVEASGVRVGFVGIDTPETFFKSTPTFFKDADGQYIYTFSEGEQGQNLYRAVQKAVDAARGEGADYVVALGHLGERGSAAEWTSSTVIANTTGIDVLLDGHSHESFTREVANKNGETVVVQQTGTKLANIGKVVLDVKTGKIEASLIPAADCKTQDETMAAAVAATEEEFQGILNKVVATSEVLLNVNDPESGKRVIRKMETNLGDLVADAYRTVLGADVGFINGGGIRADIAAGDVTYQDIINVHPYGNNGCLAQVTGKQILDALELGVANYPDDSGGFPHVSGMTFTLDDTIPSSVVKDDQGEFVEVAGERRVKNAKIGGEPVDAEKTYLLASHDYYLKNGGDGFTMFPGSKLVQDGGVLDNEILIKYITENLKGVITAQQYGQPAGRIAIRSKDPASVYVDVPAGKWYAPAVRYVAGNGIMVGTAEDRFSPKTKISYAMVMKLIANMAGADTARAAGEHWYDKAVAWARENRISQGITQGAQPGDPCKREDFVLMLYNYVKSRGAGYTGAWSFPLTYLDAAEVSANADEAMHWMVQNGVLHGYEDGCLHPRGTATRAEAAQILLSFSAVELTADKAADAA